MRLGLLLQQAIVAGKRAVDVLLNEDRVAIVGPIVAEVLVGFRRKDQADWVSSRLRLAHYVAAQWNDWRTAAELGHELAGKGHKLPLTDLIVAVVAKRVGAAVYSTDPHFDVISDLDRYSPS